MNIALRVFLLNFKVQDGEPQPPEPELIVTQDDVNIITQDDVFIITQR